MSAALIATLREQYRDHPSWSAEHRRCAPRYECLRPPRRRKGPQWQRQSFAPPRRDRPAATVVYFCTAVLTQIAESTPCRPLKARNIALHSVTNRSGRAQRRRPRQYIDEISALHKERTPKSGIGDEYALVRVPTQQQVAPVLWRPFAKKPEYSPPAQVLRRRKHTSSILGHLALVDGSRGCVVRIT